MRKSKFLSVSVSTALVASMLLSGCGNTDSNASAGGNDAGNSESSAADSSAADSGENSGDNGGSGSGEGYVLTDLKVIVDGTVNSVNRKQNLREPSVKHSFPSWRKQSVKRSATKSTLILK
nr:hypothetical protein [uncultured Acetatifactor sp.]